MRTVLLAALLAAGLYAFAAGFMAWQQRRFIYRPDPMRPDPPAEATVITVRTRDGLDLNAWFVPPADATRPVILYLHGNGGNIGNRAGRFASMAGQGWGVLLLDYRGYGGNPGSPTEDGLAADAHAAYDTLAGMGIPAERIVLWGESLGTGVATRLAADQPVAALLLESPFTSIAAIAQGQYPWLPVRLLLRDPFDLIGRIAQVHAPVLVMTGARDRIVPPAMGQAVFDAANQPKQFWLAPDAGHNDLGTAGAFDIVRAFLRKSLG